MRSVSSFQLTTPDQEKIRRLESDLYMARCVIVDLMPDKAQEILKSYHSCESRQETYRWQDDVADKLVTLVELLPRPASPYFSDRAYCPLCKGGSSSPYEEGFSVPEGLRRHLTGWGRSHQCSVLGAVIHLARNYWHDQFHAAEEDERALKTKRMTERRKSEVLYRMAPAREPELFDDASIFATPRNKDELTWVEQRLADLDFQITVEANTKSYIREYGEFVVYADPRSNGKITFRVFKKPLPTKGRSNRPTLRDVRSFYVMDSWKNDIRGKYESRLEGAVKIPLRK